MRQRMSDQMPTQDINHVTQHMIVTTQIQNELKTVLCRSQVQMAGKYKLDS